MIEANRFLTSLNFSQFKFLLTDIQQSMRPSGRVFLTLCFLFKYYSLALDSKYCAVILEIFLNDQSKSFFNILKFLIGILRWGQTTGRMSLNVQK